MRQVEYYQCPFCGWCRPTKYGVNKQTLEDREVRFDKVDPERVRVLQTRELTGGKGGGHITTVDSQTLKELDSKLKEQIKNQCEKILKALS